MTNKIFPIGILYACLWIISTGNIIAASQRKVIGNGLAPSDVSAINTNINNINTELLNTVHKTGTETIRGSKTFTDSITVGGSSFIFNTTSGTANVPFTFNKPVTISTDTTVSGNVTVSNSTPSYVAIINANRVIASDPNVTTTEIGYLDGATSNIQTQINLKLTRVGVTDGSNATAGDIGESISSAAVTFVNCSATGQYGNVASISLTAGDWNVSIIGEFYVYTAGGWNICGLGIGTATGNNSAGLVESENYTRFGVYGNTIVPISVPPYRVSLSETTTIYLKQYSLYTSGTPQVAGTIRARRVR